MPVVPSIGTSLGTGWSAFLKRAPLAGDEFADILRDQVRFRIPAGADDAADVQPDSRAAARLLSRDETAESTRRFVQGVLDLADEVSGTKRRELRGFSLATSDAGYLANRAVHHFAPGVQPSRDAYEAGLAAARSHIDDTVAVRKGPWLHLGPDRSRGLLHSLRHPGTPRDELSDRMRGSLGRGVKTLLHELNHVESPRPRAADELDWLSEGSAEALARWPGRVPHAGSLLGIDVPRGVGRVADDHGPYQQEVAAVRALLRMQGIDPTRSATFATAERLLNGTPEDRLPRAIAKAVAERHANGADEARELRAKVRRLIQHEIAPDGSHADATVVRRLARELESMRRLRADD